MFSCSISFPLCSSCQRAAQYNELKVPQHSLNSVINSLKALPIRWLSFERSRLPPLNTARDSEFARLIVFSRFFLQNTERWRSRHKKLLQCEPLICIIFCWRRAREGAMSINVRNRCCVLNGHRHDFAGHQL